MSVKATFWRFLIRHIARGQEFPDPVTLLARFNRFAQPSEFLVPKELLRLGMLLMARGLLNSQAFQHNLDWVWPYWVEQQFSPKSQSFIPRAFSVTHINLTHRNWTAVGVPGRSELPIVDPRGLVTPLFDGWSIDAWIVGPEEADLIPSRSDAARQGVDASKGMAVTTGVEIPGFAAMASDVEAIWKEGSPVCRIEVRAESEVTAWLAVSLRPYNPEGVSLIHDLSLLPGRRGWKVNKSRHVFWDADPDHCVVSTYAEGDVFQKLKKPGWVEAAEAKCPVGLITAAALVKLPERTPRKLVVEVPLEEQRPSRQTARDQSPADTRTLWAEALEGTCQLQVPDARVAFLFENAIRTLILHTPGEVYAGPYTYKRFWFRDAALIAHALACAGLDRRAEAILDRFPGRQDHSGYFHSQEGEWDSNGQVLWAYDRFCALRGQGPKTEWVVPIERGASWIQKNRVSENVAGPHAGLMPAGFSAEHLGPNDYYYWDNFWCAAGLRAAASLIRSAAGDGKSRTFLKSSDSLLRSIDRSLDHVSKNLGRDVVPVSPYRRMDSGAVASLAASYPLQIWHARDRRLINTVEYLMANCLIDDGFFHDIAHSGINPYLTLHLAQTLLRSGDWRFYRLMKAVARLASSTGRWPEAVHPTLKTGCMGDGEHVWAAAEWVMMVRNCFLREETDTLVLCSGIGAEWLLPDRTVRFGPAPTRFGPVSVLVEYDRGRANVTWTPFWRRPPSAIVVSFPASRPALVESEAQTVIVSLDQDWARRTV